MARTKWSTLLELVSSPGTAWKLVRRGAKADAEFGSKLPQYLNFPNPAGGGRIQIPTNRAARLADDAEKVLRGEFDAYDKLISETAQQLMDSGVVRGTTAPARADKLVDDWLNNLLDLKNSRYTADEQKKILEIIEQRLGKVKHHPLITGGSSVGTAARAKMITDARNAAIDSDMILDIYRGPAWKSRAIGATVLAGQGAAAGGTGVGGFVGTRKLLGALTDDGVKEAEDGAKKTDDKKDGKTANKKSSKFNWKNAGIYGGVGGVAAALAAYAMSERKNRLRNMLIAGSITGGIGAGIGGYSEEA
jgi:hypothetical protein